MVESTACAGLRPGEVIALQVGDVDLPARRIKITKTTSADQWPDRLDAVTAA